MPGMSSYDSIGASLCPWSAHSMGGRTDVWGSSHCCSHPLNIPIWARWVLMMS